MKSDPVQDAGLVFTVLASLVYHESGWAQRVLCNRIKYKNKRINKENLKFSAAYLIPFAGAEATGGTKRLLNAYNSMALTEIYNHTLITPSNEW